MSLISNEISKTSVSCMVGPPVETPRLKADSQKRENIGMTKIFHDDSLSQKLETSPMSVIPEKASSGDINFITGTMITSSGSGEKHRI